MRVLAADPGYDRLGLAVLESDGQHEKLLYSTCVETAKQDSIADRLTTVGGAVEALLEKYTPDRFAVESLFFNKNQKTAIAVAQARGILIYLARNHGCEIYEFSPQEVKVAVTGYGKSDKRAVLDMVKRLVKGAPEKALDDEYDAIAVGITCLAHRS